MTNYRFKDSTPTIVESFACNLSVLQRKTRSTRMKIEEVEVSYEKNLQAFRSIL
ncbi:hypothetical protein HID58_075601, partial [Brassica napus]